MTDVEQVFQLVVDFLRRKGFVGVATKLENNEKVKIKQLNNAPTRLEALLLKGLAYEHSISNNLLQDDDSGSGTLTKAKSVSFSGGRPGVGVTSSIISAAATLAAASAATAGGVPAGDGGESSDHFGVNPVISKKLNNKKEKEKQMGLSKSMNQTSFMDKPFLFNQRSDAPALSLLSRIDSNELIGLPSRLTYRHSREPHTPLRSLNIERRATSAYVSRQVDETPSPHPNTSTVTGTGTTTINPAVTTASRAFSVPSSTNRDEHLDEYEDDEDIGFRLHPTNLSTPTPSAGPEVRGNLEIYPQPSTAPDTDSDDSNIADESDTDNQQRNDSNIFKMELENDLKPLLDSRPTKKLSFSISKKPPQVPQASSKVNPSEPSSHSVSATITALSGTTTKDVKLNKPERARHGEKKKKMVESYDEFKDFNIVSNPGDPKLEYFNLKIIYRKAHTGFEESRDFPITIKDIVAGRYEISGYIGSAAFSRAVQCVDHKTGQKACMKIIKNNKDFFDQCLDELKLLKYINASGDPDKFHVLQMFDYFYFKEHLFIVCELLLDNLYEFYKKNMTNPDEPHYFTLPRVQKVAKQCLIALEFIHSLNLIHCDLKPENILMKDVDKCEIKVIDFGSSCYTTDVLSTYVQSRSYRAPEVILGLPYGQKIDMWSLGCILAELLTGRVIFQNYSVVTLLARIIGIIGPIPEDMLVTGNFVGKYFTEEGDLYENTEIITPKKTTLQRRVRTDDMLFLDFLRKLLTIDPAKRPSATEALQHPWIKKVYTDENAM